MYVSTQLTFNLDEIIKSFEVALRSYLADKIKPKFSSENDFKNYLINLKTTQMSSTIIFSSKIESILNTFINKYQDIYKLFENASESTTKKDYIDNQVPYVSELINIIIVFF